jgi:opacity protein-like surface antigen
LGFGPSIYHDFSRAQGGPDVGAEQTTFGAGLIVGGFWGEPKPKLPQLSEPATDSEPKPRFGDKYRVVLTGESNISWRSTSFTGVDSSLQSVTLGPGMDWFVADHFSLGAAFTYSNYQAIAFDPGGRRVRSDVSSLGGSLRVGFDVHFVEWLSLYLRLSFGAGKVESHLTNGLDTNAHTADVAWIGLSLPILVHATDHFFVGAGPAVSHDLARSDVATGYQNRDTTLGMGTLVGGWL